MVSPKNMRKGIIAATLLLGVALGWYVYSVRSAPAGIPKQLGQCTKTTIASLGTRLVDEENNPVPESGTYVSYANGLSQVSYDNIPQLKDAVVGDAVRTCLKEIPEQCPLGDERGRLYRIELMKSGNAFEAYDSAHLCGGA